MKSSKTLIPVVLLPCAALLLLVAVGSVAAAEKGQTVVVSGEGDASSSPASISGEVQAFFKRLALPERKTMAVSVSSSYDPNFNMSSLLASAAALYDHGNLWDGVPSGNTALKLEAVAGSMLRPEVRTVASLNLMALYYPAYLVNGEMMRPYLEAGIGVIYADYRVERQAYRFNFNPQLGIGAEFRGKSGSSYFVAMRLHHVSNGSINDDNQGVNSLLLQLGRFY